MAKSLLDYLPTPEELPLASITAARARLVTYMAEWYPELDTRPNSVFGDLVITPMAVLASALETASQRRNSDLDLNNVARGIIFDPEFVTQYLKNFGVSALGEVPAVGVIKLTFNDNKSYVIDADTTFAFSGASFRISRGEGNPIVIYPVGHPTGKRVLTRAGGGQFVVLLPVTGAPGNTVADGSTAEHSLTHPELVSVVAVGDFDSGAPEETLPMLADKAQKTFSAANLNSRNGALSFVMSNWPRLTAAAVVTSGDKEMVRGGENPLGISEGAIDIYLRSRPRYAVGEAVVSLTYDSGRGAWVGAIPLPSPAAFFSVNSGIFNVNHFQNNRGKNRVYSKSNHPRLDNLGVAFSRNETLGIVIEDTAPEDFKQGYIGEATETTGVGVTLKLAGEYAGHVFNSSGSRSIVLRLDYVREVNGVKRLVGNARDKQTGETVTIEFVPEGSVSPSSGVVDKASVGYKQLFNGLDMTLFPTTGSFVPDDLVGANFTMAFSGRTANFSVNYLYDPVLTQAEGVFQNADNRPLRTSIFVKSFLPCYVSQFHVNYRVRFGTTVDLETARTKIFDYINNLAYPYSYEESVIGRILIESGADGLVSVVKRAIIYPSLGQTFVDQNGRETEIPRILTETLLPDVNLPGVGQRNIGYILDLENIQFNATVI